MRKSTIFLFALRMFLYLSVVLLIPLHPGISVSFDITGIIQWFIIVPLMSLIAFQTFYIINSLLRYLVVLSLLVILSAIAGGLAPFAAGVISFVLTFMLFRRDEIPFFSNLAKLAASEPFFFVWICIRLLSLSRAGEEIASRSETLTQFILVWALAVFLLHNAVIYFCFYPNSRTKSLKEAVILSAAALAALIIVLAILPPDFVRNMVISNLLSDRVPERIRPSDTDRGIPQRGGGRRTLPRGDGSQPGLRGLSEHNWPGSGGGADESRQYMVMIVASPVEPVYMGNIFRGQLDPEFGFLLSAQEPINNIATQRLFVSWSSSEREPDRGRRRQEIFSLSTLQQKYLPWRPVSVDPLILNEDSGPLRYIHQVASNMHTGDPLQLVSVSSRSFNNRERTALEHYLSLPLNDDDMNAFSGYVNNALKVWNENRNEIIQNDDYLRAIFSGNRTGGMETFPVYNEYLEKITALLVSFSRYQYNLSYNDDHSIESLREFLFSSAEGDCVEFSNTLALLGRIAGIPSRVVTGYLAAEGLQTTAHLRGLAALRARIPALQQFPFENLYMVTNIHSHSWTQFYIPGYGWLDFESTSFALPPVGMGDFNNWDVVIPLLDQDRVFSQVRKFPWRAAIRAVITLVIIAVVCAYSLRYGREIILYYNSIKGGRRAAGTTASAAANTTASAAARATAKARSLYLLLLAKLAADGMPIKPASKTAHEYSELFPMNPALKQEEAEVNPHLAAFADLYSELRWRQFDNPTEIDERFQRLKNEYYEILKTTRRKGLHRCFIRIISLRGLAYL